MNKIFELKFGSNLYGTNTPESDLDLKAIYLPTSKEICLNNYKKTITTTRPKQPFERNKKDDVDIEIFSLDRYLQLLIEGQTVALDILFAPKEMYTYYNPETIWIMEEIYNNRLELLHSNLNSFVAYAKNQAAKYGLKGFRVHALRSTLEWLETLPDYTRLEDNNIREFITNSANEYISLIQCKGPKELEPYLEVCGKKYAFNATVKYVKQQVKRKFEEYGQRALQAEQNIGVDWKALSHSVRVNEEAYELLTEGKITFPLKNKDFILKIKKGELPYKEVADIIEEGLEKLKIAETNSILNSKPNEEWAKNFIFKIYSDIIKKS